MRIGILQADSVLEQFQPVHGNYPEMIQDILGRAARALDVDLAFEIYDVEHGVYPDTIDACDGYVITGSRKSVYDDEPWIKSLISFVQRLHEDRKKVIGLCFGHQLIAEALGGKTMGAQAGWGVGVHNSQLVEHPWFVDDEADHYTLIVSHKDQVVSLPVDSTLLASSEFCPNSMFTVGDHMLAMQGHPEFNKAYSRDLMDMREEILGEQTYQKGVASLAGALMRDDVARWIVRFLKGNPA